MLTLSQPPPAALPAQPEFPDPLIMADGRKVTTAAQWENERAPELRQLFQHYEYGFLPPPTKVEATLEREDSFALGGKAQLKEIALTWGMPHVTAHLLLIVPKGNQPAPVFVGLNFNGNHELLSDPGIRLPEVWMRHGETDDSHRAGPATRGRQEETWNVAKIIERGYGLATFYYGDIVPDEAALAAERLAFFRPPERSTTPALDDPAAVAVWAWSLSRATDYLVTDPWVDGKRIAVVGHSRLGKTALLAGAMDSRFKVIIPLQAGCGGTAPSRVPEELSRPNAKGKPTVETVARINQSFPHWFCGGFKEFNSDPTRLPFDQHELIALCAPRPVLISTAQDDLWANPAGQFAMLQKADPVYRLLGQEGLAAQEMPALGELLPSRLGYFMRPGGHAMLTPDWNAFLDFAARWLK